MNSEYVLDASVAVKWFFSEIYSEQARLLLDEKYSFTVPELFFLEIDNVLCKRIRRNEISFETSQEIREMISSFSFEVYANEKLSDSAFRLADSTFRSMYDCIYLALAVKKGIKLITADRKLYDSLIQSEFHDSIFWIEDLAKPN